MLEDRKLQNTLLLLRSHLATSRKSTTTGQYGWLEVNFMATTSPSKQAHSGLNTAPNQPLCTASANFNLSRRATVPCHLAVRLAVSDKIARVRQSGLLRRLCRVYNGFEWCRDHPRSVEGDRARRQAMKQRRSRKGILQDIGNGRSKHEYPLRVRRK